MEIKEREKVEEIFSDQGLHSNPEVKTSPSEIKGQKPENTSPELTLVPEQRVLTDQEKIEIDDSGVKSFQQDQNNVQQSANSNQSTPALSAVDPQDQLTIEEIEKQEKAALTEAVTWLANWWKRQLKVLNLKRKNQ